MEARIDYGIDAPGVVRSLAAIGALGLVLCGGVLLFGPVLAWVRSAAANALIAALCLLATALVMLWGSKVGKLRLRDRVLGRLPWRGDERVLDVGCGHGLLLIGAAKRLSSGRATGVDIWQRRDQAGNSADATRANIVLEGVADRVELRDADARELPFPDGSFDVVLSSWALHNIEPAPERSRAIAEICRVLKPGGHAALIDIRHTRDYARQLLQLGLVDIRRGWPKFLFVTPTFVLTAAKPASAGRDGVGGRDGATRRSTGSNRVRPNPQREA